jgi:DHA2 family multidrug resistance protein
VFPFVPLLLKYFDSRVLCAVGIALFALSCLINGADMSAGTGMDQLIVTQLIRAAGQPLLMSPLSQMAMVGIAPQQAGGASAIFNMMRNLGGSFGIALMATAAAQRETFHFSVIAERITHNSARAAQWLAATGQGLAGGGGDTPMQSLATLAQLVRRDAFVMAYADCFLLIGILLGVSVIGTAFLQRARPGGGGAAH